MPTERLLEFSEKKDGYASLVVTRDTGYVRQGCFIGLVIGGSLAARFDPSETAQFFVPSREIDVEVVTDPFGKGLCPDLTWKPVPEHLTLNPDIPNYFRIQSHPGLGISPRLLRADN